MLLLRFVGLCNSLVIKLVLLRSLQPSKLAQSAARQHLSPYVKPLLALPVDSEVLDLQAQV